MSWMIPRYHTNVANITGVNVCLLSIPQICSGQYVVYGRFWVVVMWLMKNPLTSTNQFNPPPCAWWCLTELSWFARRHQSTHRDLNSTGGIPEPGPNLQKHRYSNFQNPENVNAFVRNFMGDELRSFVIFVGDNGSRGLNHEKFIVLHIYSSSIQPI